jgi:hypothetical protein
VIEITLEGVLLVFSIKIGDNSGVRGNGGVGISLKVLNMFDACVEALESTIKLCIAGKIGDGI